MANDYVYCKACKAGPCLIYCTAITKPPKDSPEAVKGKSSIGFTYDDFGRDYCKPYYKPTKFIKIVEWISFISSILLMKRK